MDGAAARQEGRHLHAQSVRPARLENIRSHGREASITDLNYDDAVRLAWKMACENGWIMVQDTAWDGYEDIPHGSSKAMPRLPWRRWPSGAPKSLSLRRIFSFRRESAPSRPACSATWRRNLAMRSQDDHCGAARRRLHLPFRPLQGMVSRIMSRAIFPSLMAGLACGEPCTVGWPILRDLPPTAYVSCPDYVARPTDAPLCRSAAAATPPSSPANPARGNCSARSITSCAIPPSRRP